MKLYTIEKKNKLSAAWLGLGLMETGSVLIKEKLERFRNVRQGVSNVLEHNRSRLER
jgi:hypothetical protein